MAVPFLRAHPTASRRAALGLLLLVAFILRVWNLNWDEGTHQHPDERYWSIVTDDISAAGVTEYFDSDSSTLNPYNHRDTWVYGTLPLFTTKATASFLHDGPFPAGAIVTTADAFGIELRRDGIDSAGNPARVDAFNAGYEANLVGRLLSAIVDTGTVLMVYLLARDLFDRRTGFVAAALLTFTPLHIQYAHFYGSEPWVTFFVTAGVWLSLRLARGDLRTRMAGGVGVVMGLAVASKLIAVAALVVPATAIVIAVAPAIARCARAGARRVRSELDTRPAGILMTSAGALLILLAALILIPGLASVTAAKIALLIGALAVVAYALGVVRPADDAPDPTDVLYDQEAEPPQVVVSEHRPHPPLHIVAWGAYTGIIVLAATLLTYRIFQPYTFDGVFSIDERFTNDLDYLESVNSGGNVPWVVQWIGRTPLLYPLTSAFWWGMGPALALAVLVGTGKAIADVVRRQRWILLLPLVLVAVMLGLVSQQFNPLIRYLLPAYPVAVVLGAFGVVWLWQLGQNVLGLDNLKARTVGHGLRLLAAGLVAATAFWGLAFVNGVYNQDHPRIEASVWMAQNLPDGAVLSTQIWDDSLPLGVAGTEGWEFSHVSLDPYQPDQVDGKTEQLISGLDQVDYVVEASNRIYDSIPRIPAKYPATTAYYDALFDGRLGFEQVAEFRTSPSLFGITIPDHFAEETFTVYDHPTVTIWAKTDAWSADRAAAILNPARASVAPDVVPSDAATNALQFRPDDDALVEAGETFNDAFDTGGAVGNLPWLFWFIWLQLAAIAVLPWTTLLFSRLPDRGYGLSKVAGFLVVGLGVWLTVAWDVANYSRSLAWTWFALVGAVGLILWARHADRMKSMYRSHRVSWLSTEAVFLGVFALALWMRSANPDLWEAYLGGEKPMEMAYLTALARSTDFPAVDPWFAGGFMNYYYFGWYLLTVPMRALQVVPEVAFNLGVATYAALTATVAFSVVHNLVALSRRRWSTNHDPSSPIPARMGLIGVVLLMGIGNLDAIRLHYARLERVNEWQSGTDIPIIGRIVTFIGGSWAWATGADLERFDWWAPSRVNQGNFDITEFPYFTFLFGDLHPHLMGMVFVGLVVSLALAYILTSRDGDRRAPLILAVCLGLTTGVVRAVNTWDLPSTLIVTGIAVVIGRYLAPVSSSAINDRRGRGLAIMLGAAGTATGLSYWGGPGSKLLLAFLAVGLILLASLAASPMARHRVLSGLGHLALVAGAHGLPFWPYLQNNDPIDTGLESAVAGSPLDDFMVHWGIFLIIAVALLVALGVDLRRRSRLGEPTEGPLPAIVWAHPAWKGAWAAVALVAVLVTGRASTGAATISILGVIAFGFFFLIELRRAKIDMGRLMATGLFMLGFAIAGGVDVVTVQNDIERMNTIFKFWLQSWQYFALASGFAVWQIGRVASQRPVAATRPGNTSAIQLRQAKPWRANVWGLAVALLLLAGLAYPLLGTRTRLETRFAQLPLTLDGLAYLDADPSILRLNPDGSGDEIQVFIGDDLPLIEWLRENVAGTPVLVEWAGAGYDWNSRMAIHTGMPAVLGWDWHQKQQRWDFHVMVDERLADVQAFYTDTDEGRITDFLLRYDVSYVVVGTQERRFGTPEALGSIAAHPALDAVFTDGDGTIYRVDPGALWPGVDLAELDLLALAD